MAVARRTGGTPRSGEPLEAQGSYTVRYIAEAKDLVAATKDGLQGPFVTASPVQA